MVVVVVAYGKCRCHEASDSSRKHSLEEEFSRRVFMKNFHAEFSMKSFHRKTLPCMRYTEQCIYMGSISH
jgi:hypothetical protein